jgi:hypothetical protein
MFTKTHEVTIESAWAMDLVKVLGKHGVKFEVSDEYVDELDPNRTWYRDFTIRASERKYEKIMKELDSNVRVNQ